MSRRGCRAGAAATTAAAVLLLLASAAAARTASAPEPAPPPVEPAAPRAGTTAPVPAVRVPPAPPRRPPAGATALEPALASRVRRAVLLREQGLLDSARVVLTEALGLAPHHPTVLAELARVHTERGDWTALERLAVRERQVTRDSALLARELGLAYERTGRIPAAAQVAVDAWVARPLEGEWAQGALARLAPAAARPVREALRRAGERHPARTDLLRGLARLDWAVGDARAALRALQAADRAGARPPLRWTFAEDLLRGAAGRDSTGAVDVLLDLAADAAAEGPYRTAAAQRAWEASAALGAGRADAPRVARALADVPAERWDPRLRLDVARALREGGQTREARRLLEPAAGHEADPGMWIERALADLRDGPPERALGPLHAIAGDSPEAAWHYAEGLFFAGQRDSARAWYQRLTEDSASPFAGRAYERLFLVEDADDASCAAFGRLAYERWRGEERRAAALAESLWRDLTPGPLWAQAALEAAALREALGDPTGALAPLRAVADSLPGDRLAPLARQRLGDLYLFRIRDEAQALAQYEECLARYPRAWNAPEVRRRVDALRRERRF
jgi:uncharacterized protein HemY